MPAKLKDNDGNRPLRRKTKAELIQSLAQIDLLWFKLSLSIDALSDDFSREQLIGCCEENGYDQVAACLVLLAKRRLNDLDQL